MANLPRFVILYGSQTGTAEDCAARIGHEALRRHYVDVTVMACDDYPMQSIFDDSLFLFVIATTGQGDQPDNMRHFFKNILRKQLTPGDFSHMSFAVCGLGDSLYQKFNFSAKKVFRRLTQLGAHSLLDPVYADEQHDFGVDGLIDPWLLDFWKCSEMFSRNLPPLPDSLPEARFCVLASNLAPIAPLPIPAGCEVCEVVSHERLTAEGHFQDVRLLRVRCSSAFTPGDVAAVVPKNATENVDEFLTLLPQIDPDQPIQLATGVSAVPDWMSHPTTFRNLAQSYFDLNSVPKRSFFSVYKHFATSDELDEENLHWEKFDEFSRAEGQPDLVDYTIRPKRTVVEVLADFPSVTRKLQISDLLTLIPGIRSRDYSIANSNLTHPNEVHILYAIVQFKTMLKKLRSGLCTSYLKTLRVGDKVTLRLKKGTLRLPPEHSCHMVMVGPGTGVAPFRAFIQERVARNSSEMTLFFGCRSSTNDFLFADEWKTLENRKLLKIITAFSRDQEHKIYVQHRIKENKAYLQRLTENEDCCAIYVCGNAAQMVGDVLESLEFTLGKEKVARLQQRKLIQIEAWA